MQKEQEGVKGRKMCQEKHRKSKAKKWKRHPLWWFTPVVPLLEFKVTTQ